MSDKSALNAATTELEHVLDDKEILGRFYEFLSSIYSTESFDFWLEAGSSLFFRFARHCIAPIHFGRHSTFGYSIVFAMLFSTFQWHWLNMARGPEMYRHQDESTLTVRAEDIYTKYFGDNPESPLNVDDPTIEDVRSPDDQHARFRLEPFLNLEKTRSFSLLV